MSMETCSSLNPRVSTPRCQAQVRLWIRRRASPVKQRFTSVLEPPYLAKKDPHRYQASNEIGDYRAHEHGDSARIEGLGDEEQRHRPCRGCRDQQANDRKSDPGLANRARPLPCFIV